MGHLPHRSGRLAGDGLACGGGDLGDWRRTRRGDEGVAMSEQFDMVIVGAGFAGMYQLVRARRAGLNAVVEG